MSENRKERVAALCQSFIDNGNVLKKVFVMESSMIYPIAANDLAANGFTADEARLKECRKLISKNSGAFSYLNGMIATPFAVKLSMKDDPQAAFDKAERYYSVVKSQLGRSDYSALLAILLADTVSEERLESVAARSKDIYKRMKEKHPLITGGEDSVLAGFLALSEKDDDALIDDMEECYALLKKKFSSGDSIQSVSHILAIVDGTPAEKVARLTELYELLRDTGKKYNVYYLANLAALSILGEDNAKLRDTVLEIDEFLAGQKGYGFFGIDARTRLMHAVMLTTDLYEGARNAQNAQTAASASALAMVAAQQAAICLLIAAALISSAGAVN